MNIKNLKKYPTDALLELLFMLGEKHQSNIAMFDNSWAHKESRLVVAVRKNKRQKKAIFNEILKRVKIV